MHLSTNTYATSLACAIFEYRKLGARIASIIPTFDIIIAQIRLILTGDLTV